MRNRGICIYLFILKSLFFCLKNICRTYEITYVEDMFYICTNIWKMKMKIEMKIKMYFKLKAIFFNFFV